MIPTLSLLSIIAGIACDLYSLAGFFGLVPLEPARAALWHGGGMLLACGGFIPRLPPSYREHFSTSIALLLAFMLPLPFLGIVALMGYRGLLAMRPITDNSKQYVLGERRFLTMDRFEVSLKKTQQSILEILSSRNNALRRTAIMALRAVEAKKSLPVLVKAIADSDEQVRLLAQTQFNKIIAALELTIKKMEAEIASDPDDPGRLVELAEQYHELVYLGLSSEETEQLYLDRSIELLETALEKEPENKAARFFLLKCLTKRGLTARAEQAIEDLQKLGFQEDFLRVWRADIYFQLREWQKLEGVLASMRKSKSTDPRLAGMLEFWLGTPGLQAGK